MDKDKPSSPSPDRGISRLLRKKGGPDSPNSSLAPSDSFSGQGGIRKSIDRGVDMLKDKRRGSTDPDQSRSEESSPSRRLSKLLPKKSRRRKKNNADGDSDHTGDSSGLGLLVQNSSKLDLQSHNGSNDSLGQDRSGTSSLVIDDSEPESSSSPSRPNLASRASHKGYLTFSSPLIAAETVDSNGIISHTDPLRTGSPRAPEAATAPNGSSRPSPIPTSPSGEARFRDAANSLIDLPSPTPSDSASLAKASSFPTNFTRPASVADSKPSIRVSTFPEEGPRTPSTVITPPTPIVAPDPKKSAVKASFEPGSLPTKPLSALPRDSITHRKTRSASVAGKSGGGAPPLTPHVEESKTPGGSLIQPSNSSGFFSSVFSATQNAVTQISQTFNQPSTQRSRSTTLSSDLKPGNFDDEDIILSDSGTASDQAGDQRKKRQPAIATLGSGNLSFTHLGLTDTGSDSSLMATGTQTLEKTSRSRANTQNAETSLRNEEASAAEAVSAAYTMKEPSEKSVPIVTDTNGALDRPRSRGSGSGTGLGDATPPRTIASTEADGGSVRRTGSVRSRLSGTRRRVRNTSAPAGAIAAALAASGGAMANPGSRRPTGFAVANPKRNREFHALFKSVPETDPLIEDYSAALQRDILLQGRFYISERHICFSSNILGWVTNLVINFDEVVSMEKKSTAIIFPNAIVIQTLHAKNVFASFITRDPTYDQLIRIWKLSHPNIKTSDTGHALDESVPLEKAELADTPETDESGDETEDDDDDAVDGDEAASSIGPPASIAASEGMEATRVVSKAVGPSSAPGVAPNANPEKMLGAAAATASAQDFPGPTTHGVTECTDQDAHFDKLVLDTTIPAPLGKVYTMMFGPASGVIMKKFLVDDQKSGDLQLEDDKRGLGEETRTVSYSYIKPLSGAIGPKQTKCLVSQTLDAFDLERSVSVTCSTQTPDVPSGNVFVTKTRYCLMWGPGNSTRFLMSCVVEWSGKSWLKGPIEKGANDGQTQYGKDIAAFFKTQVAARSPSKVPKGKVKGKRKKTSLDDNDAGSPVPKPKTMSQPAISDWGPLEPLHAVLGPLGDLLGPFLSPIGILTTLLIIVTVLWVRSSYRTPQADSLAFSGLATPQRLAAYDQMWRREESQLWDWLEDRMRLDEMTTPLGDDSQGKEQKLIPIEEVSEGLEKEKMSDRQVDEAIRVTEEKLQSLKMMMMEKKKKSKYKGREDL